MITDIVAAVPTADGIATPTENDDFFSSWDKPAIKRPSNPPSRTQTPSGVNRTASPFLNSGTNGNGPLRPKSPLANADTDSSQSAPTSSAAAASRAIPSAAVRKTTAGAPRKTNVLGAKKTQKLGAKKIGGGESLDFEEAEKKAKEEAERIAKLGYDPEAEKAASESKVRSASITEKTNIVSPTPLSPGKVGGFGAAGGHKRADSETERLGMGVARLGFGQVGANKTAAPAPKKMGFGSVGTKKPIEEGIVIALLLVVRKLIQSPDDDERYARSKFGTQKGISSDEFFGKGAFDPNAQAEAKTRLQGFEGATSISSNAYFGRPEDDIPQADEYGNYGDLEGAARDFVRKFGVTAGDDLENLSAVVGEGANKLRGKLRHRRFPWVICLHDLLSGAIRNYLNS